MPFKSKERTNEYQREWAKKNRARYTENKRRRVREIKQALVKAAGDCCQICGFNKSLAALEFHHIDPNEKEIHLTAGGYSLERALLELKKCVLLCANCHRMHHCDGLELPTKKDLTIYGEAN